MELASERPLLVSILVASAPAASGLRTRLRGGVPRVGAASVTGRKLSEVARCSVRLFDRVVAPPCCAVGTEAIPSYANRSVTFTEKIRRPGCSPSFCAYTTWLIYSIFPVAEPIVA